VVWWPNGFRHEDWNPVLTEDEIRRQVRDVPVALLCERITHYRRTRVDKFAMAFPDGAYFGPGWPSGFLPEEERVGLLQRTAVGVNIHNSTGPINFRTFYLPANGVLQLCDNKQHLGTVFEVGREVIGYDTIEEAIDLCRYYLAHPNERVEIAVAGFRRARSDYNEIAVFQRLLDATTPLINTRSREAARPVELLRAVRSRTLRRRAAYLLSTPLRAPAQFTKRVFLGLARRASRLLADLRLRRKLGNRATNLEAPR
jgi:hypothetical protein